MLTTHSMMNYMTLMSYILTWAPKGDSTDPDQEWMRVLSDVFEDVSPIHHQALSTLTLLSNALLSGQSLPPYMPLPKPHELTRNLIGLPMKHHHRPPKGFPASPVAPPSSSSSFSSSSSSYDEAGQGSSSAAAPAGLAPPQEAQNHQVPEAWSLLDARNMEQKGYTEFAVLQVCSTLIIGDLEGLIKTVGDLVGTVDFSFRVEHDDSSVSDLGSVHRTGTWASRATGAGGSGGEGRKGKRE